MVSPTRNQKAAKELQTAREVGDAELITTCDDRLKWLLRKYFMLDVHGLMVKDKPASRNGVWRTYGAEGDTVLLVHRLSDQEIAWNKVLGL